MKRQEFVDAVLTNAAGVRKYELGYDGRGPDGLCDCIGLVIGAFEILGQRWPGTHGTNWTARFYVKGLREFSAADLMSGDVVFKAREPGEKGYALPDTYKSSPDQRDYYHIGVVTRTNPLQITHCTTVAGGIKQDTSKGAWRFKATLNPIEEGEVKMKKAIVEAANKKPVNLRAQPSKSSAVLVSVPVGKEIDVLEENGEWDRVQFEEIKGYMMSEFISIIADDEPMPPDEAPPDEYITIKLPMELALGLLEVLEGTIGHG